MLRSTHTHLVHSAPWTCGDRYTDTHLATQALCTDCTNTTTVQTYQKQSVMLRGRDYTEWTIRLGDREDGCLTLHDPNTPTTAQQIQLGPQLERSSYDHSSTDPVMTTARQIQLGPHLDRSSYDHSLRDPVKTTARQIQLGLRAFIDGCRTTLISACHSPSISSQEY